MRRRVGRMAWWTLAAWLLVGVGPAAAQSPADAEAGWGSAWFFSTGWQRVEVDALNDRLDAAGSPRASRNQWTFGGSGWATKGRWLVGGTGLLGSGREADDGLRHVTFAGGYGQADLGFRVYDGGRFGLTPIIGVGVGGVSLELREEPDLGGVSFDEVVDDPPGSVVLNGWGFVIDTSVLFDVRAPADAQGRVALGVRTGYAFSPADWDWLDVSDGPPVAVRGAHVSVMFGVWIR